MFKAMFSAATEAWDRRQLAAETSSRTVSLPTHHISTTNFNLTKDDADNLYKWGYDAATTFFQAAAQKAYINSLGTQNGKS